MALTARGPGEEARAAHSTTSSRGRRRSPVTQNSNGSAGTQIPYDVTGSSGDRTWSNRSEYVAPLRTEAELATAHAALWDNSERLAYLREQRGLTDATIRQLQLGWDGAHLFPVREGRGLVNVVEHRPWYRHRYLAGQGHAAALYPSIPDTRTVLLCAGMFDAAIGRQNRLPVVTTTVGARLPWPLAERFAGRRVAVVYDSGESKQAEVTLLVLRSIGADAWYVPLPLPDGGDLADWFVNYGRSRRELEQLVRAARRAA